MEGDYKVIIDCKEVEKKFSTIDESLQYLKDNGYEETNILSVVYETPTSWQYYSTRRSPEGKLIGVAILKSDEKGT